MNSALKKTGLLILLTILLIPALSFAKAPKYVFLFIGDGMGIPQRAAAQEFIKGSLAMDDFPAQGITTTSAADRFITGSAAAATAMASGKKTKIGVIGMDENLKSMKTIAEMAKEKGMKIGIVSSVSIDHATPAAFYAHVPSRGNYYDIDVALAKSGFEYFAGGTLKDPMNKKNNSANFKGDAWELIKKNGYKVLRGRSDFNTISKKDKKVIATNNWIQDSGALPYHMDTGKEDISLAEFTKKGIEFLDNKKGFFMMVEGGKIDWACHANDGSAAIKDTLAFDQAVKEAVEFYETHKKETLIVVTGDHECGGMTLGFAGTKYSSNYQILSKQKISFKQFDKEIISSIKENKKASFQDIKPIIKKYFGLKFQGMENDLMLLSDYEIKEIKNAFKRTVSGENEKSKDMNTYLLYGGYEPLSITLTHILNKKAGIAWTSYKHTALPVTTAAIGKKSDLFQGYYDNTDIGLRLMQIMNLGNKAVYAMK